MRSSALCSGYGGGTHHAYSLGAKLCWPQIRTRYQTLPAYLPSAAPDEAKLRRKYRLYQITLGTFVDVEQADGKKISRQQYSNSSNCGLN